MTLPSREQLEQEENDQARIDMRIVPIRELPQFVATTRVSIKTDVNGLVVDYPITTKIYEMSDRTFCQYLPHKIVVADQTYLFYYLNKAKPKFQHGSVFYMFEVQHSPYTTISYDGRCDVFIDQIVDHSGYKRSLVSLFMVGEQQARQMIEFKSVSTIPDDICAQTRFFIEDNEWNGEL